VRPCLRRMGVVRFQHPRSIITAVLINLVLACGGRAILTVTLGGRPVIA